MTTVLSQREKASCRHVDYCENAVAVVCLRLSLVFGGKNHPPVTPVGLKALRKDIVEPSLYARDNKSKEYFILDNFYSARVSCALSSLVCLGGAIWRRYQDASHQSALKTATPSFLLLATHNHCNLDRLRISTFTQLAKLYI